MDPKKLTENIKPKVETLTENVKTNVENLKVYSIKYKFELLLISVVLSGVIMEGILYSKGMSPWWGLIWLIPIYMLYTNQCKVMGISNIIKD